MADNQSSYPNKNRDKLSLVLEKIRVYKKSKEDEEGHISLSDIMAQNIPALNEAIRLFAPIERHISERIELVHKARHTMREYLKMKSFILDIHVLSVARHVGLCDTLSQQKMRTNIELEMEENLKNMTLLSARLANENNSTLDKDLAYNELNSLIHDLSYRLYSYKPHYQSYLADNNSDTQVMYVSECLVN